ncbi:hypothetical protein [Mycobacteroides abscessus]|uniref:hypothetical protein n=2 Tax=Mycobacteroides abscessus TaxID=36809 RepID=UPI000447A88D|nr:hypothetical protein [Mycobacteroides abscessus]EUA80238.1 putative membrane protein [Mycobacteroides abscessus subsp. bolletii 103]
MDQIDLWPAVSRMLAILAVGHGSMQTIAKILSVSKHDRINNAGRLVEASSWLALTISSILIFHPYIRPDVATEGGKRRLSLTGPAALSDAIQTYWACAVLATVSVFFLHFAVRNAQRVDFSGAQVGVPALIGSMPIIVYFDMFLEEIFPSYRSLPAASHLIQAALLVGAVICVILTGRAIATTNKREKLLSFLFAPRL